MRCHKEYGRKSPIFERDINKINDMKNEEKRVEEMSRKLSRPYTPGGQNAADKLKLLLEHVYIYALRFLVFLTK